MSGRAIESAQDALRSAVDEIGSQSALGRLLGVRQGTVSKWLAKHQPLPPEHVLKVEGATGISRHDLRPDIYPRSEVPTGTSTDSLEFDMAAAR